MFHPEQFEDFREDDGSDMESSNGESNLEAAAEWYIPGFELDRPVTNEFPFDEQQAFFSTHALETLHRRYEPFTLEHESGLNILMESERIFEDSSKPRVFLFIPYKRAGEDEVGSDLPPMWNHPGREEPRADEG